MSPWRDSILIFKGFHYTNIIRKIVQKKEDSDSLTRHAEMQEAQRELSPESL